MAKSFRKLAVVFLLFALVGCTRHRAPAEGLRLINFSHLNHLYEEIELGGRKMAIIHIYSEPPDYGWVEARDEGIACVDDAARAAVLYLRHFELTADTSSLRRARNLLEFCRYMQAEDGQFYNFIFADHSINRHGKTSYKSLGWWAARGIWALGRGYQLLRKVDRPYADRLKSHVEKTFVHIDTLLEHFPKIDHINGFKIPRWLLYNSAADATSELMLGLAAYVEVTGDPKVKTYLQLFSRGLMRMQIGDAHTFPYGLFLSWRSVWHGWGNSQTLALTETATLLHNPNILAAARTEARYFYPFWIKSGFPREMKFAEDDTIVAEKIDRFSQIAYALRPPILGCLQLNKVTGETYFAELAADLATWFFGNNPATRQMYDPATGRCYDGILSESEINLNSGAESTIEALSALLEVVTNPVAYQRLEKFLRSRQIRY